jgi:phage terminase large subunit
MPALQTVERTGLDSKSTELTSEEKKKYVSNLREFPEIYLKKRFNMPYWHDGMRKMIKACQQGIKENKPVVVGSGHAQSKDYLFGRMPLWFMEAYAPSICLMTAPTDRQVKEVMWGELSQAYKTRYETMDGFGELFKTKFEINENWYILPFTTKETGDAIGKFQGFHSPRFMCVFSEAQAIDDAVFEQVEGCMTGEVNLWVLLGNPIRSTGRFAKMLQDPKNNIVVNLNVLDSPNYKEKKMVVPGMASYEWVEDKRQKWGEADPRWYGRVLGLVPPMGVNNVISQELYDRCCGRFQNWEDERIVVACDVATSGMDDCQIYGGRNGEIIAQKTISGSTDLRIVAQECYMMKQEVGANTYIYDGNGVGDGLGIIIGMIDKDLQKNIVKVKGSESASDDTQYQNKRAELHFRARQALIDGKRTMPKSDNGGVNDMLREELTMIEWLTNEKTGRVQIESKDDIKDKLGHSPNRSDAYVLLSYGFEIAEPIKQMNKRVESIRRQALVNQDFGMSFTPMGAEYGTWLDDGRN